MRSYLCFVWARVCKGERRGRHGVKREEGVRAAGGLAAAAGKSSR